MNKITVYINGAVDSVEEYDTARLRKFLNFLKAITNTPGSHIIYTSCVESFSFQGLHDRYTVTVFSSAPSQVTE